MARRNFGTRREIVNAEPDPYEVSQESPATIFVSAKGRMFGSWIDDGGRSNAFSAGDLITNPLYQIESILRDELTLTSTQIDVANFDTVAARFPSDHKTAFSWNTQEFALTKIDEICIEAGLVLYVGSAGKFKAVYVTTQTVKDFILTEEDFLGNDNFMVYRQSPDQIANEIILRYRYNYAKNSFDKEIEVSADNDTLDSTPDIRSGYRDGFASHSAMLSTSRTKYARTYRLIHDARYIRNEATAEYLFQRMSDWHALQRYRIEADLPLKKLENNSNQTTSDIELGDVCIITHTLLPQLTASIAGSAGLSSKAVFVVTDIVFNPRMLTYHISFLETPYRSDIALISAETMVGVGTLQNTDIIHSAYAVAPFVGVGTLVPAIGKIIRV